MKLSGRWILIFAIFLFFSTNALAAGTKIAVIDMDAFKRKSVSFQKIRSAMQKKHNAMQAKLDQEQKALKKLEQEFEKQKLMLSLDAQEDKRLELDKKRRYVKYLYEDFTMEMKVLDREATKKVMRNLEKIVKRIGKNGGYSLIIEKRTPGLMYFDQALDITDQVVKIYDRENP
ncbi:MAG: OmpH family outer membrane protein [Deltaproteobacteria bacterium]|nr:OmpH family outer membrane protein [Deltaproteobacteria bacterium]MBW2015553.1 OmpH family outer membrane protein [Deltaproteobacteria bacterium]